MAAVELTDDDTRFRRDVAAWLADHVVGEYAELKGRGGPGDEDVGFDVRVAWEHELGEAGFIGLGWPVESGGRRRHRSTSRSSGPRSTPARGAGAREPHG